MIVVPDPEFPFGQGLLDVTQELLRFRNEFAVGVLGDQRAAFILRPQSLDRVAIGLLHLLIVNLADLLLRFGRFGHGGIEQFEIFVFGFRLR